MVVMLIMIIKIIKLLVGFKESDLDLTEIQGQLTDYYCSLYSESLIGLDEGLINKELGVLRALSHIYWSLWALNIHLGPNDSVYNFNYLKFSTYRFEKALEIIEGRE